MMKQTDQTQQEYRDMVAHVAELAVHYSKTGTGFFQMSEAFNDLAEKSGANKGITHEATIERRKLLVKSVCIGCISSLDAQANDRLERELNGIAEDYEVSRPRWRR